MVIGLSWDSWALSWVVCFPTSPGLCRFANTYKKCSSLSKQINSFAIMFFAFYLTTVTVWKEAVFRWNGAHTDFNDVMFCDDVATLLSTHAAVAFESGWCPPPVWRSTGRIHCKQVANSKRLLKMQFGGAMSMPKMFNNDEWKETQDDILKKLQSKCSIK